GRTLFVFHHPAEPFTTLDRTLTLLLLPDDRKEQHVPLALMIPLVMPMRHLLRQRVTERCCPTQDKPRAAFLLHGSCPPLRVGVEVGRPWWQGYRCWYKAHKRGMSPIGGYANTPSDREAVTRSIRLVPSWSAPRRQRATFSSMPTLHLQLHHTLPSERALYRVDQLVARHGQVKVNLEARVRTEGVCRAHVGLRNVARWAGRHAFRDERVLVRY